MVVKANLLKFSANRTIQIFGMVRERGSIVFQTKLVKLDGGEGEATEVEEYTFGWDGPNLSRSSANRKYKF